MDVWSWLERAVEAGASDLHLSPLASPAIRVNGRLQFFPEERVVADEMERFLRQTASPSHRDWLMTRGEVDFSYTHWNDVRIRCHVYRSHSGLSAALRILPRKIPTLSDLHLPDRFQTFTSQPGLVIITGPTGSGKSSTLAALTHHINQTCPWHVVTIEDPVEFVHSPVQAMIDQREIGTHTLDYASGLRAALREDPDVIVLGELRDAATIEVALSAAETGHLVLTSMHTGDAIQTVDRILGSVDGSLQMIRWQLASVLRAVIAQRLVPAKAGGRVPLLEVLVNTPAVANLIRTGQTHHIGSIMQTGRCYGMQTFAAHVRELIDRGMIESRLGV
ncbi:MAG: PilT/PilU family type 4a pilus ATPase [Alicyclobacillus herbarius]|uniref:type IV pilus twitching motility protein PilT n=1 Tax=Alicyclobacillus herbarius TaxID=122960 RepID=UPI000413EE44|nr:PilT/PilU family type 4a pilus ATPase [Alicyclobacillus herbarius]MCL6631611.1 PilT/PilU family type 4a pilus ATPase [Alicyclobacillus herbarius]